MKHQIIAAFIFTLATSLFFQGCKKQTDDPDPDSAGKITFEFRQTVGQQNLAMNGAVYQNSLGEQFSVTMLNYYVSNISLVREDGSLYTVPQNDSYFLVREHLASSKKITLAGVPEGNYTGLRFILGVDSLRNTLDISQRTGVLDPAGEGNGMYWTWNSGYIFLKMEGTSPASSQEGNVFKYHIGGFGGYSSPTINNIKTINLSFGGQKARVREKYEHGPEVHLKADLLKIFDGSTQVSIAQNPVVMFSPFSVHIANNYSGMFSVEHVDNEE